MGVSDTLPPEESGAKAPTRAVVVAFLVMEAVAHSQPVGVSALATDLAVPKATVQRALRTLETLGYVYRGSSDRKWSLTLRVFSVGSKASNLSLVDLAMPDMVKLVKITGEPIHLTVAEGLSVVVLAKLDGSLAVRSHTELGERIPIHASATGKAILAASSSEEVARVVSQPLERFTANTLTTSDELLPELDDIRRRGYAINRGERRPDVAAVGAAIIDGQGRPAAGLGISLPDHRFSAELAEDLGVLVLAAVDSLGRRLGAGSAL